MSEDTSRGLCLTCNYPLPDASDARCPECGRPFDRNDPTSINFGPPIGALARWWMKPCVWPTAALAAIPWWLSFVASSLPSPSSDRYRVVLFSLCSLLALALYPIMRRTGQWMAKGRAVHPPLPAASLRWPILCLLMVAANVACFTDWAEHARFSLSRSALEAHAQVIASGPIGTRSPGGLVGLYRVKEIERVRGGMIFVVEGMGTRFATPAGFAWETDGVIEDKTQVAPTYVRNVYPYQGKWLRWHWWLAKG